MKVVVALSVVLLTLSCSTMKKKEVLVSDLNVKGTYLINEQGDSVVLRGMSYGWHNWWPRFWNEGTVNWLAKDWELTVVRAAMAVDTDTSYINDSAWTVDLISTVVDAAIKSNIYVIIDWHTHHLHLEAAKGFFAMMAEKYGKYPNVIYEIFNEPVNDSWEDVKAYSEEVIKTIRAIDPDNIILVGSPHWDQDIHIVADNPIMGYENIMYTVHFYAATHKEYLRERSDYALSKGIPIFVSECAGMEASGDGSIDYESWYTWIDWMEKNKISYAFWMIADKNETCSILYPKASSEGNWADDDLRESGKACREIIKKHNQIK